MDPRLQEAAESGSIEKLYALIDENPYILDNFDAAPFGNTPLHIAAASGNLPIALELLNLKPSFATKLNTSGYSPLHLAVEKDQHDFVSWLTRLNPDLACVKGRESITPFLLLVLRGNVDCLTECLRTSPECIKDVTENGQNALHLAVINGRFEVLQVLTGWIQRMSQRDAEILEASVLNREDINHNSALHIAASNNDKQAVKLLLECRQVKRNKLNGRGLTFLDILRNQGQKTVVEECDLEQTVGKTGCKEAASVSKSKKTSDFLKSPITFWPFLFTIIRRIRSQNSDETRSVFLILCTLLITSTYQTALQPPGGVHQSGDTNAGTVVMKQVFFIFLWFSNTLGFCCALFYTFCLLPLDNLFEGSFFWIGTSLCVSYAIAMAVISPHPLVFLFVTFAFFLLYLLYLLSINVVIWRWFWNK